MSDDDKLAMAAPITASLLIATKSARRSNRLISGEITQHNETVMIGDW